MEPIRVLYVNGGIMSRGGIESYMMNYYRHLDRSKIQIDFIVHGFEKGVYDDEVISLGGKIYNIPIKSKDYFANIRALRKIFSSGNYKIVHSHMDAMSIVVLKEAKKGGIPIRIAHSHNTKHLTNNKVKFLLNEFARKNITKYATHLFACSRVAGEWLFGYDSMKNRKVSIINNAIDIDKFKFDEKRRKELRKEYNIENNFVIGHVGRFDYQKNHMFLLEILKEVKLKISNSKLILVGDGHLREQILGKIEELNLKNDVIILSNRSDVNELNNMFDLFILPSLFEGLPVVAIEAQANGLSCIFSDTITKEVAINKNVIFVEKSNELEMWINKIIDVKNQFSNREADNKMLVQKGYCIKKEAEKLQQIYLSFIEE